MRKLTRALSMLLVCCMMFTLLPVKAEALTIDGNNVKGKQFYPLTGDSGNGNWKFSGILVDENNRVHIVMANTKSTNKLDTETTLYIHYPDNPDKSFCYGHDYSGEYDDGKEHLKPSGPLKIEKITDPVFNLTLVNNDQESIGSQTIDAGSTQEYYFFEVGGMEFFKYGSFNIGLETKTGTVPGKGDAWDIGDPPEIGNPVEVHYDYGITKNVANDEDGDTIFENTPEERITYTVTIENKSSQSDGGTGILLPVYVDYVRDYVPEGLLVNLEDNKNADGTYKYSYAKDENGKDVLVLDTNVTLTPDGDTKTRTYTIVARIDPAFKGGVVRNTAVMGGDELVPKEDSVDVTINSYFYVHHIYNDGTPVGVEAPFGPGKSAEEVRVDKVLINDNMGRAHYVETDQDTNGDGVVDSDDYAIVVDGTSKFNVTAAGGNVSAKSYTKTNCDQSAWPTILVDYDGLPEGTLYGGTFYDGHDGRELKQTYEGMYNDVYPFINGENGINFTPTGSEHYYVWEPDDDYLDPKIVAVWHNDPNPESSTNAFVHTIAGYPVAAVDRVYYNKFGFEKLVNTTDALGIYEDLKLTVGDHTDTYNTKESKCSQTADNVLGNTWGRSGYIGLDKFNNNIFQQDRTYCHGYADRVGADFDPVKHFVPYWITMDGVKVSMTERDAWDNGKGTTTPYTKFGSDSDRFGPKYEPVGVSSNRILTFSAYAENLDSFVPTGPNPADVDVPFDESKLITAGKSGNVKGFTMTADLSEFAYDEAWFMVTYTDKKGEEVELRVDADEEDGQITAELNLKKVLGEVSIVPYWLDGETESNGAETKLIVEKKNVRVEDSIGMLTDDEYVEVVPTEEVVETEATEATEEVTEETEATETEAVEETAEAAEAIEESDKKNDKKNNNKKNDKNDKKNNKKDEVAETEPIEETVATEAVEETVETEPVEEPTEAPVEIVYEEITTVTFVGINRAFASAPETLGECVMGTVFQ